MTEPDKKTHFGFETVDWDDKQKKVRQVFDSVAKRYDLMNDLMSFGVHRLWKQFAIHCSAAKKGHCILDLAGGSGDLAYLLSKKVGHGGRIVLADINGDMLNVGRDKLLNKGLHSPVDFVQANAECLPFASNQFHVITMAFGLRNVTDKHKALRSMYRVCKPGGQLLILEFSKPVLPGLKPLYDAYSFQILPRLGALFAGDKDSYQYLAESIRMHPSQIELQTMIEEAGFDHCTYTNLTGGIVALHTAYKY